MPKPRLLTAEEAAALGLDAPTAPTKGSKRLLSMEEARALGLPDIEPDPSLPGSVDLSRSYRPKIDPRRAFVLGASQGGTLGFADEIGGLTAEATAPPPVRLGPAFALSPDDTPEERRIKEEALARQPLPPPRPRPLPYAPAEGEAVLRSVGDALDTALFKLESVGQRRPVDPLSYEGVRDSMRAEAAQAAEDQPRDYTTGELLGGLGAGVVSGAVPVLNTGAPASARAVRMLVGGPGLGAAEGAGGSNAPLGSPQSARDILLGAGLGAGGEVGGAVVGKVAPGILRRTGEVLEKRGVDNARKVLTSGANQLNRHMTSDLAPRIALETKAIPLWGTTETAYKRLVPLAAAEGKKYAEIVARLEAAGVPGKKAREMVDEFISLAAKDEMESGANKAVARRYMAEGQNVENLANPYTGRIGMVQEEAIKRRLMSEAQGDYLKAGPASPIGDARMKAASILRQGTEDAAEAGRVIPEEDFLYHVTPEANMSAIRKEGLRPDAPKIAEGGPHGDTQAVFLGEQSLVPTYEDLYGGNGLAVVRTSRHGLPGLTPDTASEGAAWMTPNAIPPERLQVRTPSGGWEDVVPGSTTKRIQDIEAFVPVKRRLGPLLEARNTAELGLQKFQSRTSGAGPSKLSWMGTLLGHPEVMAADVAGAISKNRLPSFVARTEFGAGRGLQGLAGRMSASGNTLPFAGGLGSVAARVLGPRPPPAAAPEPPPEGAEADLERWRLEQELRGQSRPSGAPLRRLVKKGGAPIDRSRPIINNPDGSFSTERTITIEADGRHYVIPTIVGGKQRTPDEAVRMWRAGENQAVGTFDTPAEAEAYARTRSKEIGRVRGADALRRRK